jgi:hypothetical protein
VSINTLAVYLHFVQPFTQKDMLVIRLSAIAIATVQIFVLPWKRLLESHAGSSSRINDNPFKRILAFFRFVHKYIWCDRVLHLLIQLSVCVWRHITYIHMICIGECWPSPYRVEQTKCANNTWPGEVISWMPRCMSLTSPHRDLEHLLHADWELIINYWIRFAILQ